MNVSPNPTALRLAATLHHSLTVRKSCSPDAQPGQSPASGAMDDTLVMLNASRLLKRTVSRGDRNVVVELNTYLLRHSTQC
jgi:hypothetical protein